MRKFTDPEFDIPSPRSEYPLPAEEHLPVEAPFPREEPLPVEERFPSEENPAARPSSSGKEEADTARRHRLLRQLLMKPAAALVATVTVLSSFGVDPLGGMTRPDSSGYERTEDPSFEVSEDDTVRITLRLTHLPDGDKMVLEDHESLDEALEVAREYAREAGEDPATLSLVRKRTAFIGFMADGDFYEADDEDDASVLPEAFRNGDGVSRVYEETYWYEFGEDAGTDETETETGTEDGSLEKADRAFPDLPNLEPDFAGAYAWSGAGSEEYVILNMDDGSQILLESGTYYGSRADTIDGAVYDSLSNTLTLTDFTGGQLNVNLMGNGFKLRLVGENHLDSVVVWGAMYGGSLTITGDGSLTVANGLSLNAEDSESCLMIDKGVTLDISGSPAIFIAASKAEKAIWYLDPQVMTGGVRGSGVLNADTSYFRSQGSTCQDFFIADETGTPVEHVTFKPRK